MNDKVLEESIKKTRQFIWQNRLLFLPIKLLAAFLIYANFEHGIFVILAYLLFCVSEQSARQFVNAQELNATIQKNYETLASVITDKK